MHLYTTFTVSALWCLAASQATPPPTAHPSIWPVKAFAKISGDTVKGTVSFVQNSPTAQVQITYSISGLEANSQRGFHIHQKGDLSQGCTSAGPHYNPFQKNHGAPTDTDRHVGDLGNIAADASGSANGTITDSLVRLRGIGSVIGRAVVVHAGTDDLGKGVGAASADSKKTGNAGARSACGVVGRA